MTRRLWWLLLFGLPAVYIFLVVLVGFEWMAIPIHFGRVAVAAAVLVLYLPVVKTVFKYVPAPQRDFLLAGIFFTWSSAIGFATWNEIGRTFGVDTSIFTSYVAGGFSLMLVVGGLFHLAAPPDDDVKVLRRVAICIGLAEAVVIVILSPLVRKYGWP